MAWAGPPVLTVPPPACGRGPTWARLSILRTIADAPERALAVSLHYRHSDRVEE